MTESAPRIDYANLPSPTEGFLATLFITVRKVARSRDFYSRVLGGTVVLEENPCIVRLSNSWIIMNPGGPPTPDKPGITVVDYEPGDTTSIFLNLRVADIQACYEEWKAKGAEFVTPPIDRGAEIRCYMRDPDGYLIEVGQSTGLLTANSPQSARRISRAEPAAQGVTLHRYCLRQPRMIPPWPRWWNPVTQRGHAQIDRGAAKVRRHPRRGAPRDGRRRVIRMPELSGGRNAGLVPVIAV